VKRYPVYAIIVVLSCLSLVFAYFLFIKDAPVDRADLVKKVSPAVVYILAKGVAETYSDVPPAPDQTPERKQESSGSGFIVSSDGYVVTNDHVIRGALEIIVVLQDGTKFDAELVGRDPMTDLAVLKVDPEKELPFVGFGNSDTASVGNWIIAIGSPLNMSGTVSRGIISTLGRELNDSPYVDFIQTDAAINKGNSGGPMLNLSGEVIGVNTRFVSPTGSNIGIGFAIPSSTARTVVEQLVQYGEVVRGRLGVWIQTVTPGIAETLDLSKASGVIVVYVFEGSSARRAGIKVGDIILSVGEKEISGKRMLVRMFANIQPRSEIVITVWREQKEEKIFVTVGKAGDSFLKKGENPQVIKEQKIPQLGVTLITPPLHERYNIPENERGVVVVEIEEGSSAAQKGIEFGDVILKIQGQSVPAVADVLRVLDELRTSGRMKVLLYVKKGKLEFRFVDIEMKE